LSAENMPEFSSIFARRSSGHGTALAAIFQNRGYL
jgi:hypothetical protein